MTMTHPCFSCRKRAWDSMAQDGEFGEFSVHFFQETWGPWALPLYPKLGDPFQHSPAVLDSLHCFCGLFCGHCPKCGRLLKESCDPSPECPGPQPTARTQADNQAAAGKAGPAEDLSRTPTLTVALGTSQETQAPLSGGSPAFLPAEATPGLPL